MICLVFISGVLPQDTCILPSLSLLLLSATHIQMQAITFYPFSQIRILNHLSISLPSFISNIHSYSHTDLPLSVSFPISHPPNIQPTHLVTVLVEYECVQWSVVVWSAALTMSFVSGLNRKRSAIQKLKQRSTSLDVAEQLKPAPCYFHCRFAWCKQFMSAMLNPNVPTVSFHIKRSLAWSCGGRTRGDTQFFRASAYIIGLFNLPQSPKPSNTHVLPSLISLLFTPTCF